MNGGWLAWPTWCLPLRKCSIQFLLGNVQVIQLGHPAMVPAKLHPWQRVGLARGEIITKLECLSPTAQHFVGLFFKGNLPTISTTTSGTSVPATLPMNNCTEKEFVCRASGHCIQMIQKCDFRPDCSDMSDESACGGYTKSCTLLPY